PGRPGAGQRRFPADIAGAAVEGENLTAKGHDKHRVSGNDRGLRTGDVARPEPLAIALGHRHHPAADADGIDRAVVDDGRTGDVAQAGDGRKAASAGQLVAPDRSTLLGVEGDDLARAVGYDNTVAIDGGAGSGEQPGGLGDAAI